MNQVEVCLTPELIHQHDLSGKIAVVVDIFRATSCMVTGMAHGVQSIHPVATVEECLQLGAKGMVTAGERGGIKVEGFTIGNSPYEYMREEFQKQSIAVTTTNGTRTILASEGAKEIIIGAFLNLSAVARHIQQKNSDVLIHCAGWKGTVNIEDTLYAGALIAELSGTHAHTGDAALLAHELFRANQTDLMKIANNSAHAARLAGFGVAKDLELCMQQSKFDVVPIYENGEITSLTQK
ncbi:2-phosphosulfolactate phosphatase [Marinoscillum furvescens]|uniref:Probable 2-phosphosulfolactate phosphatase n=1 Tax=Marinoscillum furvescens DSM 4134 TaxID=1122208 RepID=A0A3D9L5P5_MARFU|nr:2-phosphosulfolactate phosphatase [Marinoscillum furvescens]RED99752.1 2-phosphosulfolactate phosphatase [Marinoscillum furvescens DSM 4134]